MVRFLSATFSRFIIYVATALCLSSMSAQSETITIATGEYPPWTSKDLAHGGFMNLVVSRAFAEHNIEVEFAYMPWNRALELVKLGQYPASSYWGFDPDREGNFIYSNKIQTAPIIFFYNHAKPLPKWTNLSELKEFRFGATRGYTYTPGFWQLANSDVLRVSIANNDIENLRKLVSGSIDVFPISELTGQFLLKKHFSHDERNMIKLDQRPINRSEDFLLFSSEWEGVETLVEKFNSGLSQLTERGDFEALKKEFFETCCHE